MKAENQYSTLKFEGVNVRVSGPKACYITIGNWTIYVDNSTNEQIVDTWKTTDPVDQVTSLNEIQEELKALKAENAELKAKVQKAERMQLTSIYWDPEDVFWLITDGDQAQKYKGLKLTEDEKSDILQAACHYQSADQGLTWDILEGYIDKYLLKVYPFAPKNK
jgi:hypothetical protein